ncbi:MAG: helix-turn-helix transcriptional regulator [Prevotella sp.]|nr:helix-turn-helix transcriptional regulator [Prevotella sp.]
MFFEHISAEVVLFFILYGITGVVPAIAAVYLLLRKGNAFAPDITPPIRLRRWAAAFFAVASLGHVWWLLLYVFSFEIYSPAYVVVVAFDCMTLLTTIAGTLLSMLQDRKRSVWPVLVALIPFAALFGAFMAYPGNLVKQTAIAYLLLLFVSFTIYMLFAVWRYGRWLKDNYADLENKKVWLSQVVTLGCSLLLIIYILADTSSIILIYFMHLTELIIFGILLWRVETLPQLPTPAQQPQQPQQPMAVPSKIEQLLAKHCVESRLYLQRDLTLQQLAQAIGINRFYLSQYFSSQGITYNVYINDLRINHFMSLYEKATAAGQTIIAQQLAQESGYRSYSTFSLAFKQRTGQSVTAWMRSTAAG